MHRFLLNNRDELVARCKAKVAQRPQRKATDQQLSNGVPMFLDPLIRTLAAEENDDSHESMDISGPSGGDALALSEMGVTAPAHGLSARQSIEADLRALTLRDVTGTGRVFTITLPRHKLADAIGA